MPGPASGGYTPAHLLHVDASRWPGVALVPDNRIVRYQASAAESRFAAACATAGISLDPEAPGGADLTVENEELFLRLADSGWLGLAEGYMAGEWRSRDLVTSLAGLLECGFAPRGRFRAGAPRSVVSGGYAGGELPGDLVRLFSGDGMSAFGARFSSGVPTTVRTSVRSFVRGAGRGSEPSSHFVDVTTLAPPVAVERADLGPAQQRAAEALLDAARVRARTDLVEFPCGGGTMALAAARRGATVDCLTADPELAGTVRELLDRGRDGGRVHVTVTDTPIPTHLDWSGRYDALVSVEKIEVLGSSGRLDYLRAVEKMLAPGGYVALQSVVSTDGMRRAGRDALVALRAYIWPALEHITTEDLHRAVDRSTDLRIIAEAHFASHYETTLRLQREVFAANERSAAAAGFDIVFRRLWDYQLALMEAMFRLGWLDAVQITATSRRPLRR
ncbi:class I SAM-dependent methyltransferase [Corynebacterium sp. CCM 9185]|uniref:Class I SAM-dependent methyltransferase n=1 Tax=Corynebacterium marambiense TaxID=2765364 RepID=A0ABS0VUH0_9CORY|nr:class I SAM-dependent methyltransferase [Corynebacterium marambiense]MBI9000403.1 class I SAM-dependent methyltransferase [Corynebacterium marambiense]MCK7664156.1 class I SAM-dependent methyltransferase [Corynebacterium marambiense]MCX7543537.1 class I SAM-dependent methyltransferase [Corynebacterium marambiense]